MTTVFSANFRRLHPTHTPHEFQSHHAVHQQSHGEVTTYLHFFLPPQESFVLERNDSSTDGTGSAADLYPEMQREGGGPRPLRLAADCAGLGPLALFIDVMADDD